MADRYVSGEWRVRAGNEEQFVARWLAFTGWSLHNAPGAESFVLIRDVEQPCRFVSFGAWADLESIRAWRGRPEFAQLLGRCRELCEEFRAGDYALAASPTPADEPAGQAQGHEGRDLPQRVAT
jgi:heme-degrading monooxygenase HmoA